MPEARKLQNTFADSRFHTSTACAVAGGGEASPDKRRHGGVPLGAAAIGGSKDPVSPSLPERQAMLLQMSAPEVLYPGANRTHR